MDELESLTISQVEYRQCSIICLTESWLNEEILDSDRLSDCLYTSDFTYNSELYHLQKFADDSVIVGYVREGSEKDAEETTGHQGQPLSPTSWQPGKAEERV